MKVSIPPTMLSMILQVSVSVKLGTSSTCVDIEVERAGLSGPEAAPALHWCDLSGREGGMGHDRSWVQLAYHRLTSYTLSV